MQRIVDLTRPLQDHFRWAFERGRRGDLRGGDVFEVDWLRTSVHGFTHMDAQRHILANGFSSDQIPLDSAVGDAAVVDLSVIEPNTAVDAALLEKAGRHVREGDRVVMKSGWDQVRSPFTKDYWLDAPYMTRDGAEWLLNRKVRTVAFDFPQDEVTRLYVQGEKARPLEENITHDVLLRNGVVLVEYLINTISLSGDRTFLCVLPMKLPDSNGMPVRAVAFEGEPSRPLT